MGAIFRHAEAFPRVVRSNHFQTNGFELYVGAKTDWGARYESDKEVAYRFDKLKRGTFSTPPR